MIEFLASTSEYRGAAQNVFVIILLVAALRWGGAPERIVATTWFVLFDLASWMRGIFWGDSRQLVEVDWVVATTDILAGFVFVAVALYANRNYTLWIGGMQILAVSAHLARGLVESISPIGYSIMIVAPGWFQLVFLAIGLLRHAVRSKKYGAYRDWRTSHRHRSNEMPSDDSQLVIEGAGDPSISWRDRLIK